MKTDMGNYSLQDLALAGVRFELCETSAPIAAARAQPAQPDVASEPVQDAPPRQPVAPPVTKPVNISDALESARAAAAAATGADELFAAVENSNNPLKSFAKTILPHYARESQITIVTDAPSGDDDAAGFILSGTAGDLLDKMLSAMGFSRNLVTIVPLVFWRPAGGRAPSREEMDLSRPYVVRAIELSNPKIILTLGSLAAAEIAGAKLPAQHGEVFQLSDVPVVPIFHPNYLMLKPDLKKSVWDALQKTLQMLNESVK